MGVATGKGDGAGRVLFALVAFAGPLALYLATLAPTVTLEDSGEFIVGALHLGVVHPSGYPLWCLFAHAFTWVPWGTIAERVHLSSAVCGAATTWLSFLVAVRLVGDRWAALVGALGLGASSVLWSQSVVAEVYSLNALFTVLVLYLAVRWRSDRRAGWLYALAFTVGLGLTNHPLLVLVAVPMFVWLLWVDARAVLRWRVALAGVALAVLGLSVYFYLPIRAAAEPPLDVGRPDTIARALAHVGREVYARDVEAGRTAGGRADVMLFTRDAWVQAGRAIGWPLAVVAALGIWVWPRKSRDVLWLTIAIAVCNTLVLNLILTAPHRPLWVFIHRVYYIPTHTMVALWLASGAAFVLRRVSAPRSARATVRVALLGAVVLTGWTSYGEAHQQDDWNGHYLALDLLDSAPPGAGFVPFGDDVLYPVLYERWVEGRRPDVNVISREYGWKGEPYSVLMFGDPGNDQLREDLPGLEGYVAVPRGIAYALVPSAEAKREDYASFVPLPGDPRPLDFTRSADDAFLEDVQARYATYHARLGAKRLAEGDRESGLAELDRAEALDPGDAHLEVLLWRIHRDFGIRPERRRAFLEAALRHYDEKLDPHSRRYYPVTRERIVDLLADEEGGGSR